MISSKPTAVFQFSAELEAGGPSFMPTQIIRVPAEVVEALGGKQARRVTGTLNGYAVRLGLLPMKGGGRYLMVRKETCKAAGLEVGSLVDVRLAPDPDPEHLDLPEEFAEGLASWAEAEEAFHKLKGSYKRALVQHIADAKRPETRARRVLSVLHQLASGGNPFKPAPGVH